MENNYILFPKAKEDLENVFKYISIDLANPEAAMKLISKFEVKFKELTFFPNSHPIMENELLLNKRLRKCKVDNFLIVYLYDEINKVVEIVRVIYGRQDYSKEL
jgi:toxin ParE1/3/4